MSGLGVQEIVRWLDQQRASNPSQQPAHEHAAR